MIAETIKEKLDRWATAYTTVLSIPIFGILIKSIIDKLSDEGAKKLKKRLGEIVGIDLEDAKKDVSDEILYGLAISKLAVDEQEEVDAFERRLRTENDGKDKERAEALILFIAKIIKTFERDVKELFTPDFKRGEKGPKTEQAYKRLDEGLEVAKNFLKALLRNKSADKNETFEMRVEFLQGKNVFSLIKEKKPSALDGLEKSIKTHGKEFGKKAKDAGKDGLKKASELADEMKQTASDAATNFKGSTQSFKDRANTKLEAAKARANARRKA